MKNLYLILLGFTMSLQAHAALSFSVGQLLMTQQDYRQQEQMQAGFDFAAAYSWRHFQVGIEYFQFAQAQTGNATINTSNTAYGLQAVGKMTDLSRKMFRPYLSTGVGFEQVKIRTSFYKQLSEDQSIPYLLAFAGAGFRLQVIEELHFLSEGRLNLSQYRDPSPNWSVLLQVGIDLR